ncbi:uncharacterized protein [Procambarus clarkii]|uniref:uncharacterized protein isoform X1 n=2 Tax=Procambarus clarkii TaxID=6728 RepID=UPI00374413ED
MELHQKTKPSRCLRRLNYDEENIAEESIAPLTNEDVLETRKILRSQNGTSAPANSVSSTHYGRLVWAKISGSRSWPAIIVNHEDCGMRAPFLGSAFVFWFADNRVSQVPVLKIMDFAKNFKSQFSTSSQFSFNAAVLECIKEYRQQSGLEDVDSKQSLMKWAHNGFPEAINFEQNIVLCLSSKIMHCLRRIKRMQSRKSASTSSSHDSFFPTSSSSSVNSDSSSADERQNWKPKASLLKAARDGKHNIETLCIACDSIDCEIVSPHPCFEGGTCKDCQEVVEDNVKANGDDINVYCTVCGSPGEMLLCDEPECEREFCTGCVELLVSPSAVQRIKEIDPWYCFLCEPYHPDTHGLLKPRPEWQEKLASESQTAEPSSEVIDDDETPDASTFPNRPLRVLSLFDGIGTGLYVLDKLDLEVEAYYASEVDEAAKNVTSLNFGSRITFIGDVMHFTDKEITQICPIDLLIGGSPCNDLSAVNPNRKGLFDPNGTGILFFYYYRVLKTLQVLNGKNHLFWLYENVATMPRVFKTHINQFFQREPTLIDAKYFSPQSRPRYFWGNLPGMSAPIPKNLGENYNLSEYLHKIGNREALVKKINCITTNPASLKLGAGVDWPIRMNDSGDVPWTTEIEKIFGFPQHYTDVGNLSQRERQNLLGKSWSVPVIQHILKALTKYFPTKTKEHGKGKQDKSQVRPTIMNEDSQINPTVDEDSDSRPIVEDEDLHISSVDDSDIGPTLEADDDLQIISTAEDSRIIPTAEEDSQSRPMVENEDSQMLPKLMAKKDNLLNIASAVSDNLEPFSVLRSFRKPNVTKNSNGKILMKRSIAGKLQSQTAVSAASRLPLTLDKCIVAGKPIMDSEPVVCNHSVNNLFDDGTNFEGHDITLRGSKTIEASTLPQAATVEKIISENLENVSDSLVSRTPTTRMAKKDTFLNAASAAHDNLATVSALKSFRKLNTTKNRNGNILMKQSVTEKSTSQIVVSDSSHLSQTLDKSTVADKSRMDSEQAVCTRSESNLLNVKNNCEGHSTTLTKSKIAEASTVSHAAKKNKISSYVHKKSNEGVKSAYRNAKDKDGSSGHIFNSRHNKERSYMLRSVKEKEARSVRASTKMTRFLYSNSKISLKRKLPEERKTLKTKSRKTSESEATDRKFSTKEQQVSTNVCVPREQGKAQSSGKKGPCTKDIFIVHDSSQPSSCLGVNILEECSNSNTVELLNFVEISSSEFEDFGGFELQQQSVGSACPESDISRKNNEVDPFFDAVESNSLHDDITEIPMGNTQVFTTNTNKSQVEHNASSVFISTDMKSWQVINNEYDADLSSNSSSDPLSDV